MHPIVPRRGALLLVMSLVVVPAASGQAPQHVVRAGEWQSAEADDGWTLVACVVAPGFRYEGFELAPPGWSP